MYNYAFQSDYKIVYPTKTYYELGVKSPTTAAIILKDEVKKQTINMAHKAMEDDCVGDKKVYQNFWHCLGRLE